MENAEYDSSRPLAEQVAQKIKDYILEEKLKAGDKLPTETALAKEMGVARSTCLLYTSPSPRDRG